MAALDIAHRPLALTRVADERLVLVAVAATLRLAGLGGTPLNPFYDAAVRSMGTSWHAFLVGAFEPSAGLAIDKPPVDLWLQVASTKLLGFGPVGLLLPAALGGILAVVAVHDLLRTLFGPRAAFAGGLALAVLPIAVVSARSDTMDSVMAALLAGAFAVAARGLRSGRLRYPLVAGLLLGLAFEVKLFEALVAAPPLALLWWLGAGGARERRLRAVGVTATACIAAGLAWLAFMTVAVPGHDRPWAFGSTTGSAWNAAFVYDGWDRLIGTSPTSTPASAAASSPGTAGAPAARPSARDRALVPAPPGPFRLFSPQDHVGARVGVELAAAWVALGLVAATRGWRGLDRPARAGLAALGAWLALGTVLFSLQGSLRPRYLEALDPAIAACLGAGVVLVRPQLNLVFAAVIVAATAISVAAIRTHAEDSGAVGALPPARVAALSTYLRAHQGTARYELASLAASPSAPVIARDARPVLVLTAGGRPVVSITRLAHLTAAGAVHTALVGGGCRTPACTALRHWVRTHGTDVSRAAGDPHPGTLYALRAPKGNLKGTVPFTLAGARK